MGLSLEQRLEPTKQPEEIIAQNVLGQDRPNEPTDRRRDPDPEREVKERINDRLRGDRLLGIQAHKCADR